MSKETHSERLLMRDARGKCSGSLRDASGQRLDAGYMVYALSAMTLDVLRSFSRLNWRAVYGWCLSVSQRGERAACSAACCALALRPGWRRVMLQGVRS